MRPIILIHGFTGSPESWRPIALELGTALCLAPAVVGPAVTSFDEEIARLAAIVAAVPFGPVHVAGYSLGARLALGLLAARPELFASATLIGVHPGLTSESERAQRRHADAAWCERLEQGGIASFVAAWEAQPLFGSQSRLSESVRAEQRRIRLAQDPARLSRTLRAAGLGVMPALGQRLDRVSARVDLLVGELDAKFRALATELVTSLPRAGIEIAPDAGHNLVLERPDVVARAIARGAQAT